MANGDASGSDIQAVHRVGQICALFGPETGELTAADLAERLGLNRTTAYRYCVSLVTAGILERGHRRGTFALGGLMVQLGIHALGRRRVVKIAPPYLAELRASVRATTVLAVWGARGPVVALVNEDVSRTVVVTVHVGAQLDLDSAQLRVFLACQDDQVFERITDGMPEDRRAELADDVHLARHNGYSVVSHSGGLFAAAAPVFDEYGICATVALLGAHQPVDLSAGSPVLTGLLGTASTLTARIRTSNPAQVP
ncbi:IclR family transcriptional regulator [Amycolatopsis pithecellobii]|uniref:Helix-turn-helix domain-containing protein n=1 Tax=Amycolatopsis pithecellobii TaxID=664692 RepID=A0A6N7Z3C9_9PSEU|nr:helix-turn-helix domain-containing protein [Amycolatopsis pithecellobii]MTD53406.1 helix-turn-helix domain-containing protein [Amycolatopsis pithecellobii]